MQVRLEQYLRSNILAMQCRLFERALSQLRHHSLLNDLDVWANTQPVFAGAVRSWGKGLLDSRALPCGFRVAERASL